MIKISFQEPTTPCWRSWRVACERVLARLLQARASGDKLTIGKLYRDPRITSIYKSTGPPFFGKCAYCESKILTNQHGDMEHWRPKGKVTDVDDQTVYLKREGDGSEEHPGYYWLTYEWTNLLLACSACNVLAKVREPEKKIGKGNRFPVEGFRAEKIGEEACEKPLLLNPLHDDPSNHLEVDLETGILLHRTKRGKACIEVLGLNARAGLVEQRLQHVNLLQDQAKLFQFCPDDTKLRSLLHNSLQPLIWE